MKICLKCMYPLQAIQDVDKFVSSSEQKNFGNI